ncbi:CUB domain-containing protein, partial [uncultured Nocardioides sp.]|uniref:CUB domain-containing protein n=1 Tax=uncultured Nocardioides sp. TaxID=198441 RepID=UPI00341C91AD
MRSMTPPTRKAATTAPTGTISDGADADYANDSACVWHIEVDGATKITIHFTQLDVEE